MANKSENRNKGRNSDESVDKRRLALQEIINGCHKSGNPPSNQYLLEQLSKRGFPITRMTLYTDRRWLAKQNTFVRDIAESTYSQIIEDIFNNISLIESKAFELANKSWTKTKTITRTNPNAKKGQPKTITETQTETNDAVPKERFLSLALDCQRERMNLLKGDVTDITVAMLSKRLDQYKLQLEDTVNNSTDRDSVHNARVVLENNTSSGT